MNLKRDNPQLANEIKNAYEKFLDKIIVAELNKDSNNSDTIIDIGGNGMVEVGK